jgi:quercetin dioxygenase-like cupin family protein
VKSKDLRDLVHFSEDGPHHETVFESAHLWSEVVCLERAQSLGPISDPDSDGVCTVLAGEVAIQVDLGRKRLEQWGVVLVPAGSKLTVKNASEEPAVVLLLAAPPPTPRPISE